MRNIASPFFVIARNLALILSLVKKEIKVKYSGSILGIIWAVIVPLVMLGVYTFVFSVVFQSRWGALTESKSQFSLVLFAGLILFNLFSDSLSSSTYSIVGNENYVKKIVFPLEVLPVVSVLVVFFHFFLSFAVLLVFYLIVNGLPPITIFITPFFLLLFLLFIIGISWIVSGLSVYLRDTSYFISILCSLLLFLSPIFYAVDSIPIEFRPILSFNPLTPFIETFRGLVLFNKLPAACTVLFCLLFSLLSFYLGFYFFSKLKKGFADVI